MYYIILIKALTDKKATVMDTVELSQVSPPSKDDICKAVLSKQNNIISIKILAITKFTNDEYDMFKKVGVDFKNLIR